MNGEAAPVDLGPVLIELETVEQRRVEWLWPGRVPLGKLALLDGDPDVGKSTVTLDLAARVSIGAAMPDGAPGTSGSVVLASAEDDAADTIVPRLRAAGADLTRIRQIAGVRDAKTTRPLVIPEDLAYLEAAIDETRAILCVIDPLMAFLSGEVSSHRDQDVRRALAPLSDVAARTGAAILLVRHLNKAAGDAALYRGGGSIGIIGAARAGLVAARDPDDEEQRVLAVVKCNLAPRAPSLSYALEAADDTVRCRWLGASEHSASALLAAPIADDDRSELAAAVDYLRGELAGSPRLEAEVRRGAHAQGISDRTLRRARERLGVCSRKTGGRGAPWELSLPVDEPPPPEEW